VHFNEITLDDAAEKEELFIHAGHDYRRKVLHDERTEIDHDETRAVGNDQTLEVHGKRTKTVHKDETITVKQKRVTTVQGDNTRHVHGKDTQTVHKEQVVTCTGPAPHVDQLDKGTFRRAARRRDRRRQAARDQAHVVIADEEWRPSRGRPSSVLKEGHARLWPAGTSPSRSTGAR
jgi:uncharacterized protein involved in type VI secretion and phage assembly